MPATVCAIDARGRRSNLVTAAAFLAAWRNLRPDGTIQHRGVADLCPVRSALRSGMFDTDFWFGRLNCSRPSARRFDCAPWRRAGRQIRRRAFGCRAIVENLGIGGAGTVAGAAATALLLAAIQPVSKGSEQGGGRRSQLAVLQSSSRGEALEDIVVPFERSCWWWTCARNCFRSDPRPHRWM